MIRLRVINLSRINNVSATETISDIQIDMDEIFDSKRCGEPVSVEIFPARNGVERFLTEFEGYEKRTEINEVTGGCKAQLWYDKLDETEVLIRLLSYGPVLKITGPKNIRRQAKKRIDRQYSLLFENDTER